jgi:hypothetical protein
LAARWKIPADALADLDARMIEHSPEVAEIFALADEAQYSGHASAATDFEQWMHIVRNQLADETPA